MDANPPRQRRTRRLVGPASVRKGSFLATIITAPSTSTHPNTRSTRKVNTATNYRRTLGKKYGGLPVLGLVPASSWVGRPAGRARSFLPCWSWGVAMSRGQGHCGASTALKGHLRTSHYVKMENAVHVLPLSLRKEPPLDNSPSVVAGSSVERICAGKKRTAPDAGRTTTNRQRAHARQPPRERPGVLPKVWASESVSNAADGAKRHTLEQLVSEVFYIMRNLSCVDDAC